MRDLSNFLLALTMALLLCLIAIGLHFTGRKVLAEWLGITAFVALVWALLLL